MPLTRDKEIYSEMNCNRCIVVELQLTIAPYALQVIGTNLDLNEANGLNHSRITLITTLYNI